MVAERDGLYFMFLLPLPPPPLWTFWIRYCIKKIIELVDVDPRILDDFRAE